MNVTKFVTVKLITNFPCRESARARERENNTRSIHMCHLETRATEIYRVGSSEDHTIRTFDPISYVDNIKSCKN